MRYLFLIFFSFLFFVISGCNINSEELSEQYLLTHSNSSKPQSHRRKKENPYQHHVSSGSPYSHLSDTKTSMQNKLYGTKQGSGTGTGSWFCTAQGMYKECSGGICFPKTVSGSGMGETRAIASIAAEMNCSSHMTNMIIIGNMGGGAYSVMSCAVVMCN